MKQCAHCREFKEIEEFAYSNRLLGTRQKHCRTCMSEFNKVSYKRNRDTHRARVAKTKAARKQTAKEYVWEYLSTHPCEVCGESDPRLLEFDHQNSENKKYNISEMTTGGYSLETIKAEINKCRVLCVVHHRLKTYDDRGYYQG